MSSIERVVAPELLNEDEAADLLTVSPRTLQDWRVKGEGPPITRIGRLVRYPRAGLLAWLAENTVRPEGGVAR